MPIQPADTAEYRDLLIQMGCRCDGLRAHMERTRVSGLSKAICGVCMALVTLYERRPDLIGGVPAGTPHPALQRIAKLREVNR